MAKNVMRLSVAPNLRLGKPLYGPGWRSRTAIPPCRLPRAMKLTRSRSGTPGIFADPLTATVLAHTKTATNDYEHYTV
jgi:hypothetical protein